MAKAKTNKSQAIRDAIAANPKAKPSEIVKLLADKGVKVSGTLVYAIKAKGKAKKRKAKREKAVAAINHTRATDPVAVIRQVRQLADQVGGIAKLKELVEILGA